jgi:hypothetical protein
MAALVFCLGVLGIGLVLFGAVFTGVRVLIRRFAPLPTATEDRGEQAGSPALLVRRSQPAPDAATAGRARRAQVPGVVHLRNFLGPGALCQASYVVADCALPPRHVSGVSDIAEEVTCPSCRALMVPSGGASEPGGTD